MNDKAKKVLSYVACAIGGACLGVALLGGLSYCSTSSAREKADDVNTILSERSPKGLSGTTDEGGYTYYTFDVASQMYRLSSGQYHAVWYSVDVETYTLTPVGSELSTLTNSYAGLVAKIDELNSEVLSVMSDGEYYFLKVEGYSVTGLPYQYWSYFTFLVKYSTATTLKPFLLKNVTPRFTGDLKAYQNASTSQTNTQYPVVINAETCGYYNIWSSQVPQGTSYIFQDVESFYKELGYSRGYSTGYTNGWNNSPGGVSTDNVFSLFTKAFDAVGGFFNLEIFGFLPLYWFFLTPLFITLITLLLRMVKH